MSEFRAEDVFAVNPNIRWAGMATKRGEVIFSQMRPGVQSLTPEEDDRLLLELRSQFLLDMGERTSRWAGAVQYIAICYEKFIELTTMLKDRYVVVTVERSVPAQALVEVAKSIQNLEK